MVTASPPVRSPVGFLRHFVRFFSRRHAIVATSLALFAWLGAASVAQEPPPASQPEEPAPGEQPGFGESIDVRLAELYVTATDKSGAQVRDLEAEDFVVRENGVVQQLEAATDSRDLPITVGLSIDTSASMFVKLPSLVKAAGGLLSSLATGRDRAFLVSFGAEPELVTQTTTALDRVQDGLSDLEPKGMTPLWASITLALEELGRSRGKRALIVFFDGADEDGGRAYREALARARVAGLPVYLIVTNNQAARSGGRDFQTRAFIARLERMARAGGGEVYFVPTQGDLTTIYQRIENELRSAYLLTYYPTVPLASGGRRQVEVQVKKKGVVVRTVSGYEAGR